MKNNLSQKFKKLSQKTGVYIFKDTNGRIIYIGKAIDIKKRIQQHFSKPHGFGNFIEKIADIDWIETSNETEAILLENQLIKKYQPRYNIQWRDDKSYFYATFTQEKWPRVKIIHKSKVINNKHLKSFGPFVNGRELRHVLRALRKIIPYRTCKNPYKKPCLQWHLKLCPAHGLKSDKLKVISQKLKKYLNSLNYLTQFLRLYAGEPIRIEAYDISNIQGKYATGSMIVFYGDKPQKSDYRKFRIKTVRGADDVAMIKEVIKRRLGHPEWLYPDLILIDGGIAQLNSAKLEIGNWKLEIPLFALAKRVDEIYTEYTPLATRHGDKTVKLASLPVSLRLVFQAIRNEAHRFAIFYYRYLHKKYELGRFREKNSKKC